MNSITVKILKHIILMVSAFSSHFCYSSFTSDILYIIYYNQPTYNI